MIRIAEIKDRRDLLQVLRSELTFLDAGGYSAWAGTRWRLPLIFEESPACPNFNDATWSVRCRDCVLAKLVPLRNQGRDIPCRSIALDDAGTTLEALYRTAATEELFRVYRQWLERTIAQLEGKVRRRDWLRSQAVYRSAGAT
jgi:hypothetical protein